MAPHPHSSRHIQPVPFKTGCRLPDMIHQSSEHALGKSRNEPLMTMNQSYVLLPTSFEPNPYTVIVGRGKLAQENLGNKRLRVIASMYLSQYSSARNKRTKTRVVNEIERTICDANGLFVKKGRDGRWYQAKETVIREKIGYVFRDLLSDRYKSSSKSKVARRSRERFDKATEKMEHTVQKVYSSSDNNIDRIKALEPRPLRAQSSTVPEVLRYHYMPEECCVTTCNTNHRAAHSDFDSCFLLNSPILF